MRNTVTGRSVHPIVTEPVMDVGEIERFAIKRHQCFSLTRQVAHCLAQGCLLLRDITEQVLVNIQRSVFHHPNAKENDRTGEQSHCLDIKKDIILGFMQTCGSQHQWVGLGVSFSNQIHDLV